MHHRTEAAQEKKLEKGGRLRTKCSQNNKRESGVVYPDSSKLLLNPLCMSQDGSSGACIGFLAGLTE